MVKKVVDKVKAGYAWMGIKAKTCKAFVEPHYLIQAAYSAVQGAKNGSAWVAVKGERFKRFVERQMDDPDHKAIQGALGQLELEVTFSKQELALISAEFQKKLAQSNLELARYELRNGTEITETIADFYRLRDDILLRAAVRAREVDATFEMFKKAEDHVPKRLLDARNALSADLEKLVEDELAAMLQQG